MARNFTQTRRNMVVDVVQSSHNADLLIKCPPNGSVVIEVVLGITELPSIVQVHPWPIQAPPILVSHLLPGHTQSFHVQAYPWLLIIVKDAKLYDIQARVEQVSIATTDMLSDVMDNTWDCR